MKQKISIVMVIVVSTMLSLAPVIQQIEAADRKEIVLETLDAKVTNEKGDVIGSANQYTVIKFRLTLKFLTISERKVTTQTSPCRMPLNSKETINLK